MRRRRAEPYCACGAPAAPRAARSTRTLEDTWHWGQQAENEFAEILQQPNTQVAEVLRALRGFLGENDMMAYLTMMSNRMLQLHRVLKPNGPLVRRCQDRSTRMLGVIKSLGDFMRTALIVVVALLSGKVVAAEPFPKLTVPDSTNPAIAAFVAWHAALVKGDFAAYRSFTPAVPGMSDEMLREVFDLLRLTTPKTVKIAPPETIAPGAVRIHSAGCKGNQPVINIVTAGKQNGVWIVAGSEWGPSWDPRISDHVKCP